MNTKIVYEPVIRIVGSEEVFLENINSISDFNSKGIIFKIHKGAIKINGENIILLKADECGIVLKGKICSIEYM